MSVLRFIWRVLCFLFSFWGRLSPLQFWAGQLCAFLILVGPILFLQLTHRPLVPKDTPEDYIFAYEIMGVVISLASTSKRLQDRGVPGRAIPGTIFLGLLIPVYLFVWAMDWGFSYWESGGVLTLMKFVAASLATFAALLYIIVELGFRGPPEPEPPDPVYEEDEEGTWS